MPAFDPNAKKMLISGNEAISLSMRHCNVQFAAGYAGTPSTEILEDYSELGGYAQWAPNEKVAAEVALTAFLFLLAKEWLLLLQTVTLCL